MDIGPTKSDAQRLLESTEESAQRRLQEIEERADRLVRNLEKEQAEMAATNSPPRSLGVPADLSKMPHAPNPG